MYDKLTSINGCARILNLHSIYRVANNFLYNTASKKIKKAESKILGARRCSNDMALQFRPLKQVLEMSFRGEIGVAVLGGKCQPQLRPNRVINVYDRNSCLEDGNKILCVNCCSLGIEINFLSLKLVLKMSSHGENAVTNKWKNAQPQQLLTQILQPHSAETLTFLSGVHIQQVKLQVLLFYLGIISAL